MMLTLLVNDQLLIENYERVFAYIKRLWDQARYDREGTLSELGFLGYDIALFALFNKRTN
jgi:hypothetical protein